MKSKAKVTNNSLVDISSAVENLNRVLARNSMRYLLLIESIKPDFIMKESDDSDLESDTEEFDDEKTSDFYIDDQLLNELNSKVGKKTAEEMIVSATESNFKAPHFKDATDKNPYTSLVYSSHDTVIDSGYMLSSAMLNDPAVFNLVRFGYFSAKMESAAFELMGGDKEKEEDDVDFIDLDDESDD